MSSAANRSQPAAQPAPMLIGTEGDAEQSFYLKLGGVAHLDDSERTSLGAPVIVVDRNERCSLHEVTGIHRRRGVRTVEFGPQIDWPQGGRELRLLSNYYSTKEANHG